MYEYSEMENSSCELIISVDKLWQKYSDSKHSFSIQEKTFQTSFVTKNLKNDSDYLKEKFRLFSVKTGWIKDRNMSPYNSKLINYSNNSPVGHLPSWLWNNESVSGKLYIENLGYLKYLKLFNCLHQKTNLLR